MPETSIVIKAEDRYSDAVKAMATVPRFFNKDMREQSKTFSGLTSTLEGYNQEMQNAYGEGYNETRKKGLDRQIDFFEGAYGEKLEESNRAIGAWYASLENEKEALLREAQRRVMNSAEYREAMAAGTDEGYAEAGRLLMEAKIKAQNFSDLSR